MTPAFIFIVVALHFQHVQGLCSAPQFSHFSCCGHQMYEHYQQRCCNGVVRNRNETHTHCCGSSTELYHHDYICCDGVLQFFPGGDESSCCGTHLYDKKTEYCCDKNAGAVHVTDFYKQTCCLGKLINLTTHFCCRLGKNPSDFYSRAVIYEHSLGWSYGREGVGALACCEGKMYNFLTNMCCEDKLYNQHFRDGYRCCHDRIYMFPNQICCDTGIIVRENPTRRATDCCGETNVYNPSNEYCCKGQIIGRKDKCF